MKNIRFFKYILALSIFVAALSACSEDTMDGINKNPNNPRDTEAKFMIPELQTSTAFNVVGGDFSFYLSTYMEHEVGIFNQLYNAEIRSGEPTLGTTYNNVWQYSAYANVKTAKIIIDKCTNDPAEQGNDITLGAAKVLLAYNMAVLTDLFGDVPYTEAGEMNEDGTPKFMQPKVDKQEDIYKSIFTHLDEAIKLFDGKDAGLTGAMGSKDFIYGGKAALWKKAAYGLKARYTLRLLNRSSNKDADLQNILGYVNNSFASAAEEFKYTKYDGDQVNPMFAFSYSREYLAASQSLVDKLTSMNDPRLNGAFAKYSYPNRYQITDNKELKPAPNGKPEQLQGFYSESAMNWSMMAPTLLLSYHEIMYIKAEVSARLNRNGDAEAALKEALTASLANAENSINDPIDNEWFASGETVKLDAEVSTKYFNESVKVRFDANPLKEIMLQKYLAFWGASGENVEAYNDYRRLLAAGENYIDLKNPNKFPLRLPYTSDEMTANDNVKALYTDQGNYVYTENVWWAGGTR